MPRARKTMSGAPAQKIKSVPGQRYGEGKAQAQMQKAMPAPNNQADMPQSAPQSAPAPQGMPAVPQDPSAALRSMPNNLLSAPDNRPVTSGMSYGTGRGPEALGVSSRVRKPSTRLLQLLFDRTGDPVYRKQLERYNR